MRFDHRTISQHSRCIQNTRSRRRVFEPLPPSSARSESPTHHDRRRRSGHVTWWYVLLQLLPPHRRTCPDAHQVSQQCLRILPRHKTTCIAPRAHNDLLVVRKDAKDMQASQTVRSVVARSQSRHELLRQLVWSIVDSNTAWHLRIPRRGGRRASRTYSRVCSS